MLVFEFVTKHKVPLNCPFHIKLYKCNCQRYNIGYNGQHGLKPTSLFEVSSDIKDSP